MTRVCNMNDKINYTVFTLKFYYYVQCTYSKQTYETQSRKSIHHIVI